MKTVAKNALCGLYKYSGLMGVHERLASWTGKSFLCIVLFHRVTDEIPQDGLTVTTDWFRGFCQLMQRRFHVVPLDDVLTILEEGRRPPRRMVAITFDDCYRDNLFAARVLADHGLPATFFVPTRHVGTRHVFPWDATLKQMDNLSWDEVREIVSLGHNIGSHTATHANLAQTSAEETRRELVESRQKLEQELGRPARYFAYPFGGKADFPLERLPLVYDTGYRACFSAFGGFVYPGMKGVLPREPVPCFRSLLNLELHLAGCLDWVYAMKKKARLLM